jgi:hypothetical protein
VGQATIPALIAVDAKGVLHLCKSLPRTEAEAIQMLKPLLGGK